MVKFPEFLGSPTYTVELGYNVMNGTEETVSLWTSVALSEMYGKSEGKTF